MATAVKRKLSGSTNGRAILVTAISGDGTTIHTANSGTVDGTYDEIWLYAVNNSGSVVQLTVNFGGVTVTADQIIANVDSKAGLMMVVPGLILQNSCVVGAVADVASGISLYGFVNHITD